MTAPNTSPPKGTSSPQGKKLLDQYRDALRVKHYSHRTEQTYKDWIKRYFSDLQSPVSTL